MHAYRLSLYSSKKSYLPPIILINYCSPELLLVWMCQNMVYIKECLYLAVPAVLRFIIKWSPNTSGNIVCLKSPLIYYRHAL